MSIKIMANVWRDSTQGKTPLLCLLALADHANDEGVCWPSVGTLAKKCRVSKRQCQRLLEKLREDGEIEAQQRPGSSDIFLINEKYQECRRGDIDVMGGVTPTSPRTIREPSRDISPSIISPSPVSKKGEVQSLYEAYPRKQGAAASTKAIVGALKKEKFETLLAAVTEYAACVRSWTKEERHGKDGRSDFCPLASTWFNQERWRDDRSGWRKRGKAEPEQDRKLGTEVKLPRL